MGWFYTTWFASIFAVALPAIRYPYAISVYFEFYQSCFFLPRRLCCARRIDETGDRRKLVCTSNKIGRAAVDDRSKSNRLSTPNAATPRAGIPIPEAQRPFEPETANLKPFSRGIKRGILSFVKESIPLLFAPPCLQGTLFLHRMWKSLTPWCGRTKRPRGGSARCRWRTSSHSAYPGARCG